VLNYGPASGLLIIALSFSEVFSRRTASARAGDAVPIVMRPPMPSLEGFRPDAAASGSR